MSQAEVFNLATWNFLLGEREAEEILRDPRIRSVVVRGGIGTVLPTVSCLRDMRFAGWRDFPELAVHVPVNTLSSAFPPLSEAPPQGKLMETLLSKTYGIQCKKVLEPYDRHVVVLLGKGLENPALAQQASTLLKDLGEGKLVFVLPGGKGLPANLRTFLPRSWSAAYWDGRNAFFSSSVEEAAVEAEPAHITVIGADWQHLFYSAIGAVDFFLVQDARFRNPSELPLWEILEMGKKVTAIACTDEPQKTESRTLLTGVTDYLLKELSVASVQPDYQYGPVPNHKIAIDILSHVN